MDFRAAILTKVGAPLAIERVTLGELAPGDVLIRNRASGLCHTDLEVMQGSLAYPLPIVLGHEGAGVVEAVGRGVTQVRPGDHVVASWNPHCGHCFYCERDLPILCEPFTRHQPRGQMLDGGSRLSLGGAPLHHFSVVSSHAEYSVVPESGALLHRSFGQLLTTLKGLPQYPMTMTFLIAYLFYNDGIQTVIYTASTYGQKQLGFGRRKECAEKRDPG